jgi:hypothetical protein
MLGGPRRRWEDDIKMDLYVAGRNNMYWIDLAEDRDKWNACVKNVIKIRFLLKFGEIVY